LTFSNFAIAPLRACCFAANIFRKHLSMAAAVAGHGDIPGTALPDQRTKDRQIACIFRRCASRTISEQLLASRFPGAALD
jgi:hypothetical protein